MGTQQTLAVMAELARMGASDPVLSNALLLEFGAPDYVLDQIDRATRGHFRYRPEVEEIVRTPTFMWNEWQRTGYFEGDCDDVSVMLATIAKVLEYPVRYVAIRYDDETFKHVFVEIFDGWRWRVFDPTVAPGTEYNAIERMVEPV